MKPRFYVLDENHHAVEVGLVEWARFFENTTNRIVDYTEIVSGILVSTVFLGFDHRFLGAGPPILFETMIFGGPESIDERSWRYSSWDDATTGHAAAVRKARAAIGQKVGP